MNFIQEYVLILYYFVLMWPGGWRYIAETCRRVRVYEWLVMLCKLCVRTCVWMITVNTECGVRLWRMRNGYVKENQQVHWVCEFVYYYYYYYHHHHHPWYHLYAGYLQLYTCKKPCFQGIYCCSCRVFTICAKCNVIWPVKCILYFYISTFRSVCALPNMAVVVVT
jgi:hypothetical protein